MNVVLGALFGYLIGGFPTGIVLCRLLKGIDPRTLGSGSSGATNTSRILGKKWAALVLAVDILKGFVPVGILGPLLFGLDLQFHAQVALAAGAITGHIWTPYASFRGGKGIATATGALAAIDHTSVLIAMGCWVIAFLPFRIVSVASLFAALSLPIIMLLLGGRALSVTLLAVAVGLLMFYTHRENLRRLASGSEKPIA